MIAAFTKSILADSRCRAGSADSSGTGAGRQAARILASLALLVLAAIAVAWLPGRALASDDHPVVVSLGDSYSSGEGVEPFFGQNDENPEENDDWLAHRSELCWSGKLRVPGPDGEDLTLNEHRNDADNPDGNWYFVASSGAETRHLNGKQGKTVKRLVSDGITLTKYLYEKSYDLDPQLDVFDDIPKGTVDYVTLSLGGNDAEFVGVIQSTIKSMKMLDFNNLRDKLNAVWEKYDREIRDNLVKSYRDIRAKAGDQATIIVAGYPQLLDASEGHAAIIHPEEAKLINTNVSKFNSKIKGLVDNLREDEKMSIYFASVEERFEGHEAFSDDPYINPIIIGPQDQDLDQTITGAVSSYSVHPNEKGTWAYARAVQQRIDWLEDSKAGIVPSAPDSSGLEDGKSRDIALVLDTSGSMDGDPLDEVKRATVRFADTVIGTNTQVGLISFNDDSEVEIGLTATNEQLWIAADELESFGSTNMGAGLTQAADMLKDSSADRKIIVLMSDGEPNEGMDNEELVAYAQQLKDQGYYIYTLGFFSSMSPGSKSEPQRLLERIASEGCHYEVTDAAQLQYFFGDIADQINGVRYNYIRIACPVDVTVTYGGETLTSAGAEGRSRTSFGTLTFEDAGDGYEGDAADAVKVLRLREGPSYEVSIDGTGDGYMNYTIGFVDDNGEYSDMRYFDDIEIGPRTRISTVAEVADTTWMSVDYDGDGRIDKDYRASASSHAALVDNTLRDGLVIVAIVAGIVAVAAFALLIVRKRRTRTARP